MRQPDQESRFGNGWGSHQDPGVHRPSPRPFLDLRHRTETRCLIHERSAAGEITWSVAEMRCADTPGAQAECCLVFEAPHAFRRVYDFPPDWRSLSDEELLAVSWRR